MASEYCYATWLISQLEPMFWSVAMFFYNINISKLASKWVGDTVESR